MKVCSAKASNALCAFPPWTGEGGEPCDLLVNALAGGVTAGCPVLFVWVAAARTTTVSNGPMSIGRCTSVANRPLSMGLVVIPSAVRKGAVRRAML